LQEQQLATSFAVEKATAKALALEASQSAVDQLTTQVRSTWRFISLFKGFAIL
jgi:hypothetical protein